MKKTLILSAAIAVGLTTGFASCSSKSEKSSDAEDTSIVADEIPVAERDSITKIFDDPARKSDVATDSTYAVTETGLKYIMVKEGTGKQPTAQDDVTVHYTGQLTTGFVFDSSISRGEPATFPLSGVIKGWTEGLQYMKEGGEAIFYIPGDLAYGTQGAPPYIGPNEDLIFTVQLIKVGN